MLLFASLDDAEVVAPIGILLVIGIVVVAVVAVVQWRRVRLAEMEATLKQQMLDRGMSADEIAMVLGASMNSQYAQNSRPRATAVHKG